jgi:hypothetical protein
VSANAPAPPGWSARCTSASRNAPLECAIEQTAVLSKTGQLIVLVNIRVPTDTHAPVALVQLPLGLNLPVGTKLQVDDGKAVDLQIQTCENRGCYTRIPIARAADRPEIGKAVKGVLSKPRRGSDHDSNAACLFCRRLRQDKITAVSHPKSLSRALIRGRPYAAPTARIVINC